MFIKRCFLTLIEMLLVLAILGLVAGVLAINVAKAVNEQRFRTEVSIVVDRLRLAQNLMLIFHRDVRVKFIQNDKFIEYSIEPDIVMEKGWLEEFQRRRGKLTTIHAINFEDLLEKEDGLKSPDKEGEVTVVFLSDGSQMSRGTMRLSTASKESSDALTRYVYLPGYPSAITSETTRSDHEERTASFVTFEKQLTQRMHEELRVQ